MPEIIVPATSANMGPGFDSLGLAVNLYLKVRISKQSDQWIVHHPFDKRVPTDEKNMIVLSALTVDASIQPHEIFVESEIPLARGLGSSSSAIIAGLMLGNELSESINLSKQQILDRAVKIEGHPDNVSPAIFGGIVVGGPDPQKKGNFLTYQIDTPDDYLPIAVIPDRELATSESRDVLPTSLDRRKAVRNNAESSLLLAALFKHDWDNAARLLESDQFHEVYRTKLVPELKTVRNLCHSVGIFGSYLSGAGTTVMIIAKKDQADFLLDQLNKTEKLRGCKIKLLEFNLSGANISE